MYLHFPFTLPFDSCQTVRQQQRARVCVCVSECVRVCLFVPNTPYTAAQGTLIYWSFSHTHPHTHIYTQQHTRTISLLLDKNHWWFLHRGQIVRKGVYCHDELGEKLENDEINQERGKALVESGKRKESMQKTERWKNTLTICTRTHAGKRINSSSMETEIEDGEVYFFFPADLTEWFFLLQLILKQE